MVAQNLLGNFGKRDFKRIKDSLIPYEAKEVQTYSMNIFGGLISSCIVENSHQKILMR